MTLVAAEANRIRRWWRRSSQSLPTITAGRGRLLLPIDSCLCPILVGEQRRRGSNHGRDQIPLDAEARPPHRRLCQEGGGRCSRGPGRAWAVGQNGMWFSVRRPANRCSTARLSPRAGIRMWVTGYAAGTNVQWISVLTETAGESEVENNAQTKAIGKGQVISASFRSRPAPQADWPSGKSHGADKKNRGTITAVRRGVVVINLSRVMPRSRSAQRRVSRARKRCATR